MNKHTPGPWYAEKKNIHTGCVATCQWGGDDWWEVWSPNWSDGSAESNARLIAAAPDLLEALEGMVEMVEMNGFGKKAMMDIARAAINKARNEK